MRSFRFLLLLPPLVGLVWLASGFRGNPSALLSVPAPRHDPAAEDLGFLPANDQATALLDRVLAELTVPRLHWLQTTLVQLVHLPGVSFAAEGRYLVAPDQRFRLDLRTRTQSGQTTSAGQTLLVCDGVHVWSASRVGDNDWHHVARRGIQEIPVGVTIPPTVPQDKVPAMPDPAFGGLVPVLRNLRQKLCWVRHEAHGADQVVLTGCWPAELIKLLAPPGQPWPDGLPRRCTIRVRAATLWPERIEWWTPSGQGERLLAEMEFRDPILNQPLPPEVCAREFSLRPGSVIVSHGSAHLLPDLSATAPPSKEGQEVAPLTAGERSVDKRKMAPPGRSHP